jgi:tripartite-type tricarboxylate transporter receptor subunit TctC
MTKSTFHLTRRRALILAAATAFAPAASFAADDYPTKAITFVCAFPAGSGADVLVRYFSNEVAKVAGQTIIVENKPGANGNIAAEFTARAKPDGYTVFVHAGNSIAANMSLFKKPPVDVVKDLQGVQFVNKQPFMIAVSETSPIKNIAELTAYLKGKNGDATYASTATSGKVMVEVYKHLAEVGATEVSYKTGPDALNDITSGAVDFAVLDPVFAISQQREVRVRILGISAPERMKSTPDFPTMKEQGVDIDQLGWWGVFVPTGTPAPVVEKLNDLFGQVLEKPETAAFLGKFGGDVYTGTPQEVQELLAKTVEEWRGYMELAKIPKN